MNHKNQNPNTIEWEELLEHLNDELPERPNWRHRAEAVNVIRVAKSHNWDVAVLLD